MTTTEWDGTPWGGTVPPDRALVTVEPEVIKATTGPFAANVEFGTYLSPAARTPQAMMRRAQIVYHTNPWIGSAESTVTRRVAGLPWHLEDENDEEYAEPYPAPVKAAFELLERPQKALPPEKRDPGLLTRRALISITSRHLGLCGMAYWYLDQMDTNGIPVAILYVNPARVWAVTAGQGRVIGWILDPADDYGHGGTPLTLSELLPFYLDPPDQGAYGTGMYERAVQKVQITNLADRHAAYVLGTGGRLAGIVAPKEGTIPEEAYTTLVREFRNVNEAPDAAKRTTILRGPVDFIQTAASPDDLNLNDMNANNRDDIFAIWGVPPRMAGVPSAGGLNSGETAKQDEAILMQGPVHDRVVAIREVVQFGLLDRWQEVGTIIDLEIDEPEFDDRTPQFELAAKAVNIPLTNLERRELIGLEPFGDQRDEEIWLPALQTLAYSGTNGPQFPGPDVTATVTTPPFPQIAAKAGRREFLGLRRSVDTRWLPAVKRTVAGVLAAQRKEVAAKVRGASPDELARQRKNKQHWYDRASEATRLRKVLEPVLAAIAEAVGDRTNALLKDQRTAKADPFTESIIAAVLRKVGIRIGGITETTQDAVAAAIAQGYDQGLSPAQIGDLIEDLPAFNEARAELVARTESMFAYNEAALTSYNEFGVTQVEAIDGDEDEECAARDGQTYDVDEAFAIEDHPNGTLDWVPVMAKAEKVEPIMALIAAIASQKSEASPVINLTAQLLLPDTVEVPTPIVNVSPPEVHVSPPEVHVAAPIVNVVPPPMRTVIDYDAAGEVLGYHEEPV